MKYREDLGAVEIDFSFEKIKSLIIQYDYSRIPVYEEINDNI
jgi:CBS domain containing-hemolysin-like protein